MAPPTRLDERWSLDFVLGARDDGRRFVAVLQRLVALHGAPARLLADKEPEFISWGLDAWADAHGIDLHVIEPGKPTQHAYVESFSGRLPDGSVVQTSGLDRLAPGRG